MPNTSYSSQSGFFETQPVKSVLLLWKLRRWF